MAQKELVERNHDDFARDVCSKKLCEFGSLMRNSYRQILSVLLKCCCHFHQHVFVSPPLQCCWELNQNSDQNTKRLNRVFVVLLLRFPLVLANLLEKSHHHISLDLMMTLAWKKVITLAWISHRISLDHWDYIVRFILLLNLHYTVLNNFVCFLL